MQISIHINGGETAPITVHYIDRQDRHAGQGPNASIKGEITPAQLMSLAEGLDRVLGTSEATDAMRYALTDLHAKVTKRTTKQAQEIESASTLAGQIGRVIA